MLKSESKKVKQEGKSQKEAYGNKIGNTFLSLKNQDSHFFLPQQKKLRFTM
jgi:hypothetical protein